MLKMADKVPAPNARRYPVQFAPAAAGPSSTPRFRPARPQIQTPQRNAITPVYSRICCRPNPNWPLRARGTSEPSAELNPMTRVLARDTPRRLTLSPKKMAPNPHAKPKINAHAKARGGELENTRGKSGTVQATSARGAIRQLVTMKTSQIFSHFQDGISFMGVVNNPLQMPERRANPIPSSIIGTVDSLTG